MGIISEAEHAKKKNSEAKRKLLQVSDENAEDMHSESVHLISKEDPSKTNKDTVIADYDLNQSGNERNSRFTFIKVQEGAEKDQNEEGKTNQQPESIMKKKSNSLHNLMVKG